MAKRDFFIVNPAAANGEFYAIRRSSVVELTVREVTDSPGMWLVAATTMGSGGGVTLEIGFRTKQAAEERAQEMMDEF